MSAKLKALRSSFGQAADGIEMLLAAERADPRINPECHSISMDHGEATPRAIVLLHGITASPVQFRELGALFHARGYNVLIPRLPRHGYRDRLSTDHGKLTGAEYIACANQVVDLGRGLGQHLTVAGLSVSGVIAAWCAQQRADLDLAVLIAPALAPFGVPPRLVRGLAQLALHLPNLFIWWDPRRRAQLGPACSYPRFSTHAMAQSFRLGADIYAQAGHMPPACRAILTVTNPRDPAVNNAATQALVRRWRQHAPRTLKLSEFQFGPPLGALHDVIGPYQPNAQVDYVYPLLLEQIDAATMMLGG